ncbi:MAG: response regulator [Pseudomonadota bacterium]
MDDGNHVILCVDDEANILHSLKRLLRKEPYRLLTASSGREGLEILKGEDVHLIISDQRMPDMSGTEFLARVKEDYPDIIRIVLTGYTEVDSITDSINKGHIYKFFLKPWNDEHLKLEVREALNHYDLIQSNRELDKKVLEQNGVLKRMNDNLETLVQERTQDLEIQNQALELSRTILDSLPIPILGVSSEGIIVLLNKETQIANGGGSGFEVGKSISDYFTVEAERIIQGVIKSGNPGIVRGCRLTGATCDIDVNSLDGRFRGKGVVLRLKNNGMEKQV